MALRFTTIALAALMISGIASGLVLTENAEIPVVKAPLGPMKVKPDPPSFDSTRFDINYVLDQLAIPYITDAKIKNDLASALKCATPTAYYLSYNPHPEKAVLIERADEIVARFQRR